jgi:SpoIID/LytB domain protein
MSLKKSKITGEPVISVGIIDRVAAIHGAFHGPFAVGDNFTMDGEFRVQGRRDDIIITGNDGKDFVFRKKVDCKGTPGAYFTLRDVSIGRSFHWETKEEQNFSGDIAFVSREDQTITAINTIGLEEYLSSVIASEMSSDAPLEFLKAHAIASRSWLGAMLTRQRRNVTQQPEGVADDADEIIRWYDREDHDIFDVCADDHCQRYQGISKRVSAQAAEAVKLTRGLFLVHDGNICDARFSKCCGGLTESFENVWDDNYVPYLSSISDSQISHPTIRNETEAERWITSHPDAYCNTSDEKILATILPPNDRQTKDFFRWKVEYDLEELGEIIRMKSGIDFGTIVDIIPLQRGFSGRLVKLRIKGSKRTITIGKELEIRRWLSKTHLYSSAFVARKNSKRLVLLGAGWGHGVGMCQIGAAIMAVKRKTAEEIVKHYFRNTTLQKLY